VELGAGVTNVSVFAGGMLVGLKSLSMGGMDITDDIASAFGTRRVEAERMKCFYGSAMTSPRDNHDMIELSPIAGSEEGTEAARITRAQLIAVIRQRLEHLTGEIAQALKDLGFGGPFGRQVVLTGGGSELKGIADYAQGVLGRAVRIGRPALRGLPEAHSGPAFTTLVGLAQFAASNELDLRSAVSPAPAMPKAMGGNLVQRLVTALRSGF
jgi:cell division protein FtsA